MTPEDPRGECVFEEMGRQQRSSQEKSAAPVETRRLLRAALSPAAGDGGASLLGLLDRCGIVSLSRASAERLAAETLLSPEECRRLVAIFDLGRRVEEERWARSDTVRTPAGVYRLMAPKLRGVERETFYVLLLDGRHRLRGCHRVSEGTLTTSLVHPREVFSPAIRDAAAAIIVVHNHPSGDPEPSREDLAVSRRLADAGRLLGIPLLDHVVIGEGAHASIRERIEL